MPTGKFSKLQMKLNVQIGSNVRKRREKLGITQEMLAAQLDFGRTQLCNMEYGRSNWYAHHLYRLAALLDCRIGDFFKKVSRD